MGKQFLVIGAGRFGSSVAKTLYTLGHDVMIIDENEELIQAISSSVTNAAQADATSETALKALGVRDYDAVILAIGVDIQASLMAAILLIELEAKYIVAKAQTDLHGRVLSKIGINRVVYPERDMGQKLAHSLFAPAIIDLIELSENYSVVEVAASEEMVGKTLKELDLRAKYGISVIALRQSNGDKINIAPLAGDLVEQGHILIVIGANKSLKKMEWI